MSEQSDWTLGHVLWIVIGLFSFTEAQVKHLRIGKSTVYNYILNEKKKSTELQTMSKVSKIFFTKIFQVKLNSLLYTKDFHVIFETL